MATIRLTARRTVVALGIAAAIAAAPAVAMFAGSPRVVADPGECTTSGEPGDASLDCAPAFVPEIGAPSEMELTDTNPGIGSPEHSHH
jgi:hypothetical protein